MATIPAPTTANAPTAPPMMAAMGLFSDSAGEGGKGGSGAVAGGAAWSGAWGGGSAEDSGNAGGNVTVTVGTASTVTPSTVEARRRRSLGSNSMNSMFRVELYELYPSIP